MPYSVVEQQIAAAFLADAGVAALVGTRVHGGKLPRNEAMPALLYNRVDTVRTVGSGSYTLDRGYTGFCWGRFQFDCFGAVYNTAVQLAIAVRLVVCRLDFTGGGVSQASMILDERDLSDPNAIGEYRRSLDAKIWFQEEGRDG